MKSPITTKNRYIQKPRFDENLQSYVKVGQPCKGRSRMLCLRQFVDISIKLKQNLLSPRSLRIISSFKLNNLKSAPKMTSLKRDEILLLFDVDGTLTPARKSIEKDFEEFLLTKVKPKARIGVVSGSDLVKIKDQLNGDRITSDFDYVCPENGLILIKNGVELSKQSIQKHIGEANIKRLINFCLHYIADLDIPIKRGTFIDYRNGMINICPIGRQCTYEERLVFNQLDSTQKIRENMVAALMKEFADVDITFAIGGQISIDAFPRGWDKSYCLQHFEKDTYKEIHFFGDKTSVGGNDYEIFADPRTIGHTVTDPRDTQRQLSELLGIQQ